MIQRVIEIEVDGQIRACPITNMFDANGKDTIDFNKAEAAVVRINENAWINIDPEQIPVYTVH